MPDPAVVVAMREFKAGLLVREALQMQEMARHWLVVEQALEAQISALTQEIASMRAAGETVTRARLYRLRRYQRLLAQATSEFENYAAYAADLIEEQQRILASLGVDHAYRAIQYSYWPSMRVALDRLPISQIEYMVGLAGNGAPLGELLKERMIQASGAFERLTGTLIQGTAQGWNPRKTARRMQGDLAAGLQKALLIARSEQMRVYRTANLEQMRQSGVVEGWKRLVAHDGRVCAACLADEKTLYKLEEEVEDHPGGRCVPVPVVKGMPEVDWLSGEDWLRNPDPESRMRILERNKDFTTWEDVQRAILGKGRYEAWVAGQFEFSQLVTRRYDPVWGGSITPTPLKELVA